MPAPQLEALAEGLERMPVRGDQTLFIGAEEVEAQWRICDPIGRVWQAAPEPPPLYSAGSQGPAEATRLMRPGHTWRRI